MSDTNKFCSACGSAVVVLGHGRLTSPRGFACPNSCSGFEVDESFTLKEMNESYIKYMQGELLTDKQRMLAETKAHAARMCT